MPTVPDPDDQLDTGSTVKSHILALGTLIGTLSAARQADALDQLTDALIAAGGPPRLGALWIHNQYRRPSSLDPEQWADELISYGATGAIWGVNVVPEETPRFKLLGDPIEHERLAAALRARDMGVGLDYWDKPHDDDGTADQLVDLTHLVEPDRLGCDQEFQTYGKGSPLKLPAQHAARATRIKHQLVDRIKTPWGLSLPHHHLRRARPYLAHAAFADVQILGHHNPDRGLDGYRFGPGVLNELVLDSWGAVEGPDVEGLPPLVPSFATYKQNFDDVPPADAIEVTVRHLIAEGYREAIGFSLMHCRTVPGLGPVLRRLAPHRAAFQARPEPIFTEDGAASLGEPDDDGHRRLTGDRAERVVHVLKKVWDARGYAFFEGHLNVNIVLIRDPDRTLGIFNDAICLVYQDGAGDWIVDVFDGSVEPGPGYERRPVTMARNRGGVAILADGQHRGAWVLGKHFGQPALVQGGGPVTVWRDPKKDGKATLEAPSKRDRGRFGINFHPASKGEHQWGGRFEWSSAGCQIFASKRAHDGVWLDVLRQSAARYGNRFSATLIDGADFIEHGGAWPW